MTYWEEINEKLKPRIDTELNKTVVDLFAGCGGLSLGFEANGFKTIGYEMDESDIDISKIENLLAERETARNERNFERADEIRDELKEAGVEIEDTPKGSIWRKIS